MQLHRRLGESWRESKSASRPSRFLFVIFYVPFFCFSHAASCVSFCFLFFFLLRNRGRGCCCCPRAAGRVFCCCCCCCCCFFFSSVSVSFYLRMSFSFFPLIRDRRWFRFSWRLFRVFLDEPTEATDKRRTIRPSRRVSLIDGRSLI